jgi:hypothetical protein
MKVAQITDGIITEIAETNLADHPGRTMPEGWIECPANAEVGDKFPAETSDHENHD